MKPLLLLFLALNAGAQNVEPTIPPDWAVSSGVGGNDENPASLRELSRGRPHYIDHAGEEDLGPRPQQNDRVVAGASNESLSDWTALDTSYQLGVTVTLLLDYAQTRDIKNHAGWTETNKLLGEHPSDVRVRNYFIGVAVGHYAVSRALPSGWPRRSWQAGWIAIEVAQVIRNKKLGLTFKF